MSGRAVPAAAYAAALAGLPGMGPRRLHVVLSSCPGPAAAWHAVRAGDLDRRDDVRAALRARDPAALLAAWRAAAVALDPGALWERCRRDGITVRVLGDGRYPEALASDPDPPAVLFARGRLDALRGPRVAIVGTRRCTSTGAAIARELGAGLAAAGVGVVSGLALGIDGAAHAGALSVEGAPPVGVVGSGLDVVYPRRHDRLWHEVATRGVLLAEAPPGARPERWRFPARNRVLAGLADLVVVVESHARGGSHHTVDAALERDVPVMAVPGSVRSPASAGTNQLLADGAPPARDLDDVLVALGRGGSASEPRPPVPTPPPRPFDVVVRELRASPATVDVLATRTALPVGHVLRLLHDAAASGAVREERGWWAASND